VVLLVCLTPGGLLLAGARTAKAQRGAITLPRNLADLSAGAGRIVQGRVVAVRVEPHPVYKNLKTLLLTLSVDDVLKGDAAKTLTFREFLWDIRDIADGAGYRVGDEVLLFLNKPTVLGLTSPVGLEQGRFRVIKSASGEEFAVNASGNAGLMNGVLATGRLNVAKLSAKSRASVESFQKGPIALSALKESVQVLVKSQAEAQ
jgi:hypothetical protein